MGSCEQILLHIRSLRWTGNEHAKPYFSYTKRCCFSIKSNLIPLLARCIAEVRPAKPAPTITTSNSSFNSNSC